MGKKWISGALAALMLIGLGMSALAAEGQEAPPAADVAVPVQEAAPTEDVPAEEGPPASDETAPAEEMTNNEGIMPISDEPMAVAADGVTVNLTGALEGIKYDVTYTKPNGDGIYFACKIGIYYVDYNLNKYWVEQTSDWPRQFVMYPGTDIKINLRPGYDVTFDNATVKEDKVDSWYGGGDAFFSTRYVTATAPNSGTVTINVTKDGAAEPMPKLVDFTFHNNTPDIVVGSEDWGSSSPDMKTLKDGSVQWKVNTGGEFSEWVAPGYAIEVLKGGYVVKTEAPSGPAAAGVPAGSTSYVLHVDLDADEFVIAAVKQGESFLAPCTDTPQAETPPAADTTTQTSGTFTDVASGVWYESPVMSAYEKGIVKGVTGNTFSPNSTTTRGQTVTMLYRAMGSPGGANVFSDTSGEVGSAAGWAASAGVTTGTTATTFAPNSAVTREQLVTMLYRLAGSPAAASAASVSSYTDSDAVQSYARDAVAWAIGSGLLTGYGDGSLKPGATATRAEVCALIMRYLGA